ncbi:MAG: RimK/LysX family protein [Rhodospirillales bacterium]
MTPRMPVIFALLAALSAGMMPARADSLLETAGLIETVRIQPEAIDIRAKVDTGAENSSVDTRDWETFEREGATWIRFTLRLDNGGRRTLERPLHRMAEIHRAGSTQNRPVVLMTLCVGAVAREVEVNLSERPKLTYRMLLGASFLTGAYVVDVSQSDLTRPACGETVK